MSGRPTVLVLACLAVVPAAWGASLHDHVPCGALDGAPVLPDDAASGRDASGAMPVPLAEGAWTACVDVVDPSDWFLLELPAGEAFVLRLAPPSCSDLDLVLADEDGRVLAGSYLPGCAVDAVARDAVPETRYRVGVVRWSGGGPYALEVLVGEPRAVGCPTTDDAASGRDARRDLPAAVAYGASSACTDDHDGVDDFAVVRESAGAFTVRLEVDDCFRGLGVLYDADGARVRGDLVECGDDAAWSLWSYGHETFRLAFETWSGSGDYRLALEDGGVQPPPCHPQDDGGSGLDAGPHAPVPFAGATAGCLDAYDGEDLYAIAPAAGRAEVAVDPSACADYDLVVRDADGRLAGMASAAGCSTERVAFDATGDAYTVLVARRSGEGAYDLVLAEGSP